MKKPKKTLKDLGRIEAVLSKQTARSAKLLARRKSGDAENPVTRAYYDHIAEQHAIALADLSEIVHLSETLSRHVMEADAERATKKAAKAIKAAPAKAAARPARASRVVVAKPLAKKPAVKRATRVIAKPSPVQADAKRPARRPPTKKTTV